MVGARELFAAEEDDHGDSCAYSPVEGCPHHPNLVQLGLCVDMNKPNEYVLLLGIVVFSVIVEYLVHRVDHWAAKHPSYVPILNSVYRELMLLGIISFFLYIAETLEWCALRRNLDVESFEFAHYLLFFVSLFYIFTVLYLLVVVRRSYKRWAEIQAMPQGQVEQEYTAARTRWMQTPWFLMPFHPLLVLDFLHKREAYTFLLVRTSFLVRFQDEIVAAATKAHLRARLPPPTNDRLLLAFDFVRFLRKCTRHVLLKLLHLAAPVIGLLVTFIVIQIIRLSLGGSVSVGIMGFIGLQGYVMLVPFFIALSLSLHRRLNQYRSRVLQSEIHVLPFRPIKPTPNLQAACSLSASASKIKTALGLGASKLQPDLHADLDSEGSEALCAKLRSASLRFEPSPSPASRPLSGRLSSVSRQDLGATLMDETARIWSQISPNMYFSLLQIITYWQSFYVAGALLYIHIHIVKEEDNDPGFHILTWIPPVFAFAIALPTLLPTFTVLACVSGQYTHLIPSTYRGEAHRELVAVRKERAVNRTESQRIADEAKLAQLGHHDDDMDDEYALSDGEMDPDNSDSEGSDDDEYEAPHISLAPVPDPATVGE